MSRSSESIVSRSRMLPKPNGRAEARKPPSNCASSPRKSLQARRLDAADGFPVPHLNEHEMERSIAQQLF